VAGPASPLAVQQPDTHLPRDRSLPPQERAPFLHLFAELALDICRSKVLTARAPSSAQNLPTSPLSQPEPELDRRRVDQSDPVDVGRARRQRLRTQIEDPLLVGRI